MSTLKQVDINVGATCPICGETKNREDLPICGKCYPKLRKSFENAGVAEFMRTGKELVWSDWLVNRLKKEQEARETENQEVQAEIDEINKTITTKIAGEVEERIKNVRDMGLKDALRKRFLTGEETKATKQRIWAENGGNKLYARLKDSENRIDACRISIELAVHGPQPPAPGDHLIINIKEAKTTGTPTDPAEKDVAVA